jgi:hypothetical protein
MSEHQDQFLVGWWAENLQALDREIARLATLCQVKILDLDVIRRVLKKDETVCATPNPIAFAKLHDLLKMHMAVREKSAAMVGEAKTEAIEDYIIERLRKSFPDAVGRWPPG